MAWTATLGVTRVSRDNRYATEVTLSNGTSSFVEGFVHDGSTADLRDGVIQWITNFESRSPRVSQLTVGMTVNVVPDAPVVQPPPTAAEVAQANFITDWRMYQSATRGLQAGLPINQSQLSALQASLVSSYRTSYTRFL